MGWWSSKSPAPPNVESQSTPSPPSDTLPTQPSPPPPPPQRTLSREEQADAEFKQLLASLESDINRSPNSSPEQSSSSPSTQSPESDSAPASIAPESLYPDSMSCRTAFDYAFFCQSLGGQFVNVYRYGELRSCSEHWDNFWLCMKTRTFRDSERKRIIRDHYRKKAIKYKTGPSSEDVWEVRMEPMNEAFQGDFAALEKEMKAEEDARNTAAAAAAAAPVV
ncbi:hypothetical protein ARAM_005990 [Aspergillus rambellii]|uniref:Early meiotic induction protein 1 n=1 Tax=Aspergillus rambellii TaxID=308745 RepID=A0A0F8V319_9EURO|nr:hypothetical protein ARAM_005990 [Aspergillus rambellii]